MDVVVLDFKAVRFDFRKGETIEARVFDVDDFAAIHADEMMMLAGLWIEARGGPGVASLGDEAESHECAEDAVDGHARNLRKLAADGAVELFGGGMIGAVEDGF